MLQRLREVGDLLRGAHAGNGNRARMAGPEPTNGSLRKAAPAGLKAVADSGEPLSPVRGHLPVREPIRKIRGARANIVLGHLSFGRDAACKQPHGQRRADQRQGASFLECRFDLVSSKKDMACMFDRGKARARRKGRCLVREVGAPAIGGNSACREFPFKQVNDRCGLVLGKFVGVNQDKVDQVPAKSAAQASSSA